MKASKRISLVVTLLLLAAAGYGGYWYFTKPEKATFLTAAVTRGTIESAISATGTLAATLSVPVGSRVSGNVLDMLADYNTPVKKGQLVATIDPQQFETALRQAQAQLRSAETQRTSAEVAVKKADVDVANAEASIANNKASVQRAQSQVNQSKRKWDQQKGLFDQGIASKDAEQTAKETYDQAVLSLESAQAQLKTAEASLEAVKAQREVAATQKVTAEAAITQAQNQVQNAQLNLDYTKIQAPVDGVVIARNMSPGQTVQASTTAPQLFEIAQDLTKMQVETNIDESDIARLKEGMEATFTVDAYPGQTFRGIIKQVRREPVNVSNVITYTVVISVDNPDLRLFPGMTANTRIVTERAENTLRIPSAALRFRPADALIDPQAKAKAGKGGKGGKGGEFKGKEGVDFSQFKGGGDREDFINQLKAKGIDPSQFQGRGGGRGRNGGGGGRGRGQGGAGGVQTQTVYVKNAKNLVEPIRVRTGISDGSWVALLGNNLEEGQELVTAVEGGPAAATKNNNAPGFPGGGGDFRGGRGRGGFFF